MSNRSKLMLTATLLALSVAGAGAPAAPAAGTCKPATNIEAIIDDSYSMSGSDPSANRAAAIKLLAAKDGNAKKTLGALVFGSPADYLTPPQPGAITVFKPLTIGPNVANISAALDQFVTADHGATDYNSAFALAKTDNPTADARIFITDGGHNEGEYANGHQGGPPTYVVGMGIGKALNQTTPSYEPDSDRLQRIAKETGGKYFPDVDNGNVQSVVNEIDAALNCQTVTKTFTDVFKKAGQSKSKVLAVGAKTKSIDFTLTWANPTDVFTISGITLKNSKGQTIGISKAKKLKVKRTAGKTFVNVRVSGLKKGKLKFKLKNKVLTPGLVSGVNLTTQATPRKK